MRTINVIATAAVGLGALTMGVSAPAMAEGGFTSYLGAWYAETDSHTWPDQNLDNTNGRATFANCNQDVFNIGIYREDFGPDTQVGREDIQCRNHADAVYAGDVKAGKYHFTLKSGRNVSADVRVYY